MEIFLAGRVTRVRFQNHFGAWVGGMVVRALVLLLVGGEIGLGDLPEGLLERAEGEVVDEDVVDVVKALRGGRRIGQRPRFFRKSAFAV